MQALWLARLPPRERCSLTHRNVYILPTRAGAMFACTLAVLLLTAINYQLALGYALVFLLAGAAFASMHVTHATLRGLELHLRPPEPGFAHEALRIEVVVTNAGAPRYGLGLGLAERDASGATAWLDVPAGAQAHASLHWRAPRRGEHAVPLLRVHTRFPLGLFRAWALWRPAARQLAYPAPERPAPPLPAPAAGDALPQAARRGEGAEFDGVRPYRRGDSLRRIVWKKAARGGELVARDVADSAEPRLWLDWVQAARPDAEARLSRLAAWAIEAERAGLAFGLRLPGRELEPGSGAGHRRRVLDALARWPA